MKLVHNSISVDRGKLERYLLMMIPYEVKAKVYKDLERVIRESHLYSLARCIELNLRNVHID